MKALKCEMCNSNDIVKQDGMYVCQYCGTKYSVEEARKLMIEGQVDVSGSTVKIDNADKLANLYQLARRAVDTGDSKSAVQYYGEILIESPGDWEAAFYSSYFLAQDCTYNNMQNAMSSYVKSIQEILKLIKANETIDRDKCYREICERTEALRSVYDKIISDFANEHAAGKLDALGFVLDHTDCIFRMFEDIADVFSQEVDDKKYAVDMYEKSKGLDVKKYERINEKILKLDPTYQPPVQSKSGGCYVATAVYGSYDCPEVWTLRRYRDNELAKTWYGRCFIRIYYAVSPTLVKWFGDFAWFKKFWLKRLDSMVAKLKEQGYESTQYEDKVW